MFRMENVSSSSSGLRVPSAAMGLAQQQQMGMAGAAGNRSGNSFY